MEAPAASTVSIILANPKPASFCHGIAKAMRQVAVARGFEVRFHDLCQERFEPVLEAEELAGGRSRDPLVEQHCLEAQSADAFILVHPNWWGQPPAILKGWVDRVLRPGVGYRFTDGDGGEGVPVGLLKARFALVLNTSDTTPEREQGVFGDPLEAIWARCVFPFCGVPQVYRRTYATVVNSTPEQRSAWVGHARDLAAEAFGRHF